MTLPALLAHSTRYRRRREPRVVIRLYALLPNGGLVWLDIPAPEAADHGSAA